MTRLRFIAKPPPGSLRHDGHDVLLIQRAPDGRFYVARDDASTVILTGEELAAWLVVEDDNAGG